MSWSLQRKRTVNSTQLSVSRMKTFGCSSSFLIENRSSRTLRVSSAISAIWTVSLLRSGQ